MKWLQRWEFSAQAEQSLQAECDLALQYGYDGILAKALDGTMWMGVVDGNADALRSADDVQRQADYAHSRGLQFAVWVNPLQQSMSTQADLVSACINNCDGAAFDTEPYAGFLGAYPPPGLCAYYMQRVKSQVDASKMLILQPDPRAQHLLEVRFADEWAPYATHYAPQDYVQDFYNTPTPALMRNLLVATRDVAAQANLIALTTLPGNVPDTALIPSDALAQFDGFIVWRIGSTNANNLGYIGGLQVAQPTPPTPVDDPCADLTAQVQSRETFIADIADRIVYDGIAAELARKNILGRAATPRRAVLQSIADAAEASRAEIMGPRAPQLARSGQPLLKDGPLGNLAEGSNPH